MTDRRDRLARLNQDSGNVEWFTPPNLIGLARQVLGQIDLDVASCEAANEVVRATRYFTREDDGLSQDWFGNVFMNHPYGRDNRKWIAKLISEFNWGYCDSAICVTWAATSEVWFRPLHSHAQCYLYGRQNFVPGKSGMKVSSPTKGICVTYLGTNRQAFASAFGALGAVKVPA